MGFLHEPRGPRTSAVSIMFPCFWLIFLVQSSVARVIQLKWEVEYKHWTPDCIESVVMTINGTFPGPTIEATAGDTVNITLTNHLHTEGVVIHWHGITQKGTPWADGTASISQCAINAGETFVYTFTVEKAGTFFYHGHYGMQRSAGLYGSLIVREAEPQRQPFKYDDEFNLLLSDWWHQNVHRQEVDLSGVPLKFVGEPQSLLINGKGQYNCSIAAHFDKYSNVCNFTNKKQCEPEILHVKPNKKYRIRIASTTALASLNFMIQGHKLEVVEADGNYVKPFFVDDLDIYSGESYSVLLNTNQGPPSGNYWISIGIRGRAPGKPPTPPALAILNYYPMTPLSRHPSSAPPVHPVWDNYTHSKSFSNAIKALTGPKTKDLNYKPPPHKQDRRIVLLNTQNFIKENIKWTINNVSLTLPNTPYLGAIKYGIDNAFSQESPPDHYNSPDYDIKIPSSNDTNAIYSNAVYKLQSNKVIDVILQNANMLTEGHSEIHPWHLHGHDFWVLGYGEGKFNDADESLFNTVDPPLRNTVVVYPYGWTALRFETDNPGVWAFHCHIEPHLHMGMGVIFAEGVEEIKKMKINKEALVCGLTGKMFMNSHRD